MPRLLMVAFSFPPAENSGARRPAALAKYLPRFGWEVIVLTPKMRGVTGRGEAVVETDYRDVIAAWKAKLHLDGQRGLHEQFHLPVSSRPGTAKIHTLALTICRNLLAYPDIHKGWIPFAVEAVKQIRQRTPIDAILTTSPPISCQLIGRKAKEILGCPWVADFRDLWTQDITTAQLRDLRFLQIGLEKATLRRADLISTVSEPWAERMRRRHPGHGVCAIPNGFDPDDFLPRPQLTRQFSITHAGVLHDCRRNPEVLLEALGELIRENIIPVHDVKVRFFGPQEPALAALVSRYGLEQVVELKGVVPRREVLQREMESQLLLLLTWTHPRDTGLHTGKLFEYLGAARPILAIGGTRGAMSEVLQQTHAGTHALNKAQVRQYLVQSYGDYKRLGFVPFHGDAQAIAQYSHVEMARRFSEELERLCSLGAERLAAGSVSNL